MISDDDEEEDLARGDDEASEVDQGAYDGQFDVAQQQAEHRAAILHRELEIEVENENDLHMANGVDEAIRRADDFRRDLFFGDETDWPEAEKMDLDLIDTSRDYHGDQSMYEHFARTGEMLSDDEEEGDIEFAAYNVRA